MHHRHVLVVGLAVGALSASTLAGCGNKADPEPPVHGNPPAPEPAPAPPPAPEATGEPPVQPQGDAQLPHGNPPAPQPTPAALPTWDAVESGHPPGATNPPAPVLVMTPATGGSAPYRCFKAWVSPMNPSTRNLMADRVEDPLVTQGTEVQCPEPRAGTLFATWKKP